MFARLAAQRDTTRIRHPSSVGTLGTTAPPSICLRLFEKCWVKASQPLQMPKAVLKRRRRYYSRSNRAPGCHDPARRWLLGRAVLCIRKIATKAALSQQLASSATFFAALMTWVASCSRTCLVRRSGPNISGRFPALARPARSEFSRLTLSVLSVGCRIFRKPKSK